MNIEYYRSFAAVVENGTISAAAKKTLIAQPALSNQIKYLENEFGAKLFIRGSRHMELTDAGQLLYGKIKTICHLEDSARTEIEACVNGSRGTLWLGTTPAYPDGTLTQMLLDFHAAYPGASFEIFEQNSYQIIQLLKDNVIEIGLVRTRPNMPPQMRTVLTMEERMMAYYHHENKALSADAKEIPVDMLKNLPISIAKGFREDFNASCQYANFTPSYVNVSASRALSQIWAADRNTVAVVVAPEAVDEGDYCLRPIICENSETKRSFVVKRGRELSQITQTFIKFCRQYPLFSAWEYGEADGNEL